MNIIGQILCLKIITIIAIATLFLTTTPQRSNYAYAVNECLCPLAETLEAQILLAEAFGLFNPNDLTCRKTKDEQGRHATTEIVHSDSCEFRIETGRPTGFITNFCSANTPGCPFVLQYFPFKIPLISNAEQVACRNEIKRVARRLGIPCEFDEL